MGKTSGTFKVAAATTDGISVNVHFGKADTFAVYEIATDGTPVFVEERTVTHPCGGGYHDENLLEESAACISDCKYVLVSRVGPGAARVLAQAGCTPIELTGYIEDMIPRMIMYDRIQNLY